MKTTKLFLLLFVSLFLLSNVFALADLEITQVSTTIERTYVLIEDGDYIRENTLSIEYTVKNIGDEDANNFHNTIISSNKYFGEWNVIAAQYEDEAITPGEQKEYIIQVNLDNFEEYHNQAHLTIEVNDYDELEEETKENNLMHHTFLTFGSDYQSTVKLNKGDSKEFSINNREYFVESIYGSAIKVNAYPLAYYSESDPNLYNDTVIFFSAYNGENDYLELSFNHIEESEQDYKLFPEIILFKYGNSEEVEEIEDTLAYVNDDLFFWYTPVYETYIGSDSRCLEDVCSINGKYEIINYAFQDAIATIEGSFLTMGDSDYFSCFLYSSSEDELLECINDYESSSQLEHYGDMFDCINIHEDLDEEKQCIKDEIVIIFDGDANDYELEMFSDTLVSFKEAELEKIKIQQSLFEEYNIDNTPTLVIGGQKYLGEINSAFLFDEVCRSYNKYDYDCRTAFEYGELGLLEDAEVKINGDWDDLYDNSHFEVEPLDEVTFGVSINNEVDDLDELYIQASVRIPELDYNEYYQFTLQQDDDEVIDFELNIPANIEEGSYDVELKVVATYGDKEDFISEAMNVEMDVDKRDRDVYVTTDLSNSTYPGSYAELEINLLNIGSMGLTDAVIQIQQQGLGIFKQVTNINIESNEEFSTTETLLIPSDTLPGNYELTIKVFEDNLLMEVLEPNLIVLMEKIDSDEFNGQTPNFNEYTDEELEHFTDLVIENTDNGMIDFGDQELNLSEAYYLDEYVEIQDDLIAIDTNNLECFDGKSATLTLYGVDSDETHRIVYYDGFTTNKNTLTEECPESICSELNYNENTKEFSFKVEHFSTYGIEPVTIVDDDSDDNDNDAEEQDSTTSVANIDLIDEVKVYVNGHKEEINDGEKIKANPGDDIKIKIKVDNNLGDAVDFDLELDCDELYEDDTSFYLDDNEDDSEEFEFQIPWDIDEDKYDLKIEIDGETDNDKDIEQKFSAYFDVDKEKHLLKLTQVDINKDQLVCDENAYLSMYVSNYGQKDEEGYIKVESSTLDINKRINFELEEEDSIVLNQDILANKNSGKHNIAIKLYMDNEYVEQEIIIIDIDKCVAEIDQTALININTGKEELNKKESSNSKNSEVEDTDWVFITAIVTIPTMIILLIGTLLIIMKKKQEAHKPMVSDDYEYREVKRVTRKRPNRLRRKIRTLNSQIKTMFWLTMASFLATAGLLILAVANGYPTSAAYLSVFIDIPILTLLAYGIYKKSRVASSLMVIYFALSKVIVAFTTTAPNLSFMIGQFIAAIIFMFFFVRGMIATFELHKLRKRLF